MDCQTFLISFSHNDQIVTVDRCSQYDQLVEETVQATNGQIQSDDIESFQYEALFGDKNITITAKNTKALFRVPNQQYYALKCIVNIAQDNDTQALPMHNKQPRILRRFAKRIPIIYKLPVLSRKRDSMSNDADFFSFLLNNKKLYDIYIDYYWVQFLFSIANYKEMFTKKKCPQCIENKINQSFYRNERQLNNYWIRYHLSNHTPPLLYEYIQYLLIYIFLYFLCTNRKI